MISFIVMGKNEGWRLYKCLSSIQKFIRKNISAIIPSIIKYRVTLLFVIYSIYYTVGY